MNVKQRKKRLVIFGGMLLIMILCVVMGVHKPQQVTAATTKKTTSTKYPYLIKVNKKMNTVTIYKKDTKGKYTVPIKAMVCSTGKNTPIGTFKTKAKYRWKWLYHNVYGQYSTRITGPILFHSVYYYKKNPATLSIKEFNKLGTSASMGCVRLQVVDAKWIYDNCGVGTKVVIYSSNNPGPLGKPKAIKMGKSIAWDPTDTTNKKNPYNKKKPTITGVKNITIAYGSTFLPKKGMKAYNTCGYKITDSVKVTSNVNTKIAGNYKVTYKVTDKLNRKATKTITVKVKPMAGMPIISGVGNKQYLYNKYKGLPLSSYVLNGITAHVGGQKLGSSYIKYTVKTVINNNSMVKYAVTYSVTNGAYKATKTAYIYLDKQAPTILGAQDMELTAQQLEDLKKQLEEKNYRDVTFSDNCTASNQLVITTSLTAVDNSNYLLIYKVKDKVGLVSTKSVNIHIVLESEPVIDPQPGENPEL